MPPQPQQGFDVNAARQAGYSDDEILQHLTQSRNFDVNGALQAGYSQADIINHLSTTPAPQPAQNAKPYGPEFAPYTTQQNYQNWLAQPPQPGPMVKAGEEEAWISAHTPGGAQQALKQAAVPVGMAAATMAPIMTGGASLPVQAAVSGASGAGFTKLAGGSNTAAGISAGLGAAIPFLGPALGQLAERFSPAFLKSSAGGMFNAASQAAGANPVSVEGAGQAALGAQELQQVGRTMPRVMTRFLQRVTAPDAAPLTFDEARQFYSAASELSANENAGITPAMRRQLSQFKSQLGQAIQQTADNAGVGGQYSQGMSNYAKASRLEDNWELIRDATMKNLVPYLIKGAGLSAGGAAAYGTYRALTK